MALTGNERLYVSSQGGGRATVSANEVAALAGEGAVTSVNTQTGDVVLSAADVGAATAAQGALADNSVQLDASQSIGGTKTFTSRILVPVTPISTQDAASMGYVNTETIETRSIMDQRLSPNQRAAINALNPATATTADIVNALQA